MLYIYFRLKVSDPDVHPLLLSVMVIRAIIDNRQTFNFWSLRFMFFIKSICPLALIFHPKEKWQNTFGVWWMMAPLCGSCNGADDKELSGLPINEASPIVIWIRTLFEMVIQRHWIGNLTTRQERQKIWKQNEVNGMTRWLCSNQKQTSPSLSLCPTLDLGWL